MSDDVRIEISDRVMEITVGFGTPLQIDGHYSLL